MKILITLLYSLFLIGCYKYEESTELTESVIVLDTIYTPSAHGSGSAIGISTSGNLTFAPVSIDIPETFSVVFKCQHGKFIINNKDIYNIAIKGMEGTVLYKEKYRTKDRVKTLYGYDFISFIPKY